MGYSYTAASVLDPEHCRAICDEVGERLRYALPPASELPERLASLLQRLAEQDHDAPSIVPSLEVMEIAKSDALTAAA